MNDILDIEIILKRKKYPKIYNIGLILTIIILIFIYIIFTYKYQTYCLLKGRVVDNQLELFVSIDDIKYIKNNNILEIDNVIYSYTIDKISSDMYLDENYHNYQYIYINIPNISNIENYVYEIKIPKENKIIAKYLKEYI